MIILNVTNTTEKKIKYLCRAIEIAEAVFSIKSLSDSDDRKLSDIE
jgi:hypothetical protein